MYRIFLLAIVFVACTDNTPRDHAVHKDALHVLRDSLPAKIERAKHTLVQERARLQTLRDSQESEIRRNIALGIPAEQAQSIEQARIKVQETLVIAAEKNLMAQQTLLDSLVKYPP